MSGTLASRSNGRWASNHFGAARITLHSARSVGRTELHEDPATVRIAPPGPGAGLRSAAQRRPTPPALLPSPEPLGCAILSPELRWTGVPVTARPPNHTRPVDLERWKMVPKLSCLAMILVVGMAFTSCGISDEGEPCTRKSDCEEACMCGANTKPCQETNSCTTPATEKGTCTTSESAQCGCALDAEGIPQITTCP